MLIIIAVFSAFAGSHRPLCEKVRAADLVFEIGFKQRAKYPQDHLEKQWAPPQGELTKTLKTGTVETVFKGDVKLGQKHDALWEIRLNPGGSSVDHWVKFLSMPTFRQIVFLKEENGRFNTTGWAEESAPCRSSAHRSWCLNYSDFKRQIQRCMSPLPDGAPTTNTDKETRNSINQAP